MSFVFDDWSLEFQRASAGTWQSVPAGQDLIHARPGAWLTFTLLHGIVALIFIAGALVGIAYGVGAGTIRSDVDVMKGMAPKASYRVRNRLSSEGGEFAVNLAFDKVEDFRPESVVQQVEPLRKLLEARTKLSDLRNKLAGNDKLEDILADVLANTEKLAQLGQETAQTEE